MERILNLSELSFTDRLRLHNVDIMSEVTFVVQGERIPAHKAILATVSPVFHAMFNGPLAPKEKHPEIKINDFSDAKAFIDFLKYLYVEESRLDKANVFDVMYLAKKYIVPSLEQRCRMFIINILEEDNVLPTLELALDLDDKEIETSCMGIVCKSIQILSRREDFLQLSLPCLTHILKSDDLVISEVELFLAVCRWCCKQVEEKRTKGSEVTWRSVLGNALYFIRFPVMSRKEFMDHCLSTELLTGDESRDILFYINHLESRVDKRPDATVMNIAERLRFPKEPRKTFQFPWDKFLKYRQIVAKK